MSDKTFLLIKNMNHLKELYLKAKIKTALRRRFGKSIHEVGETSLHYMETATNEIKADIQAMINQCLEIQLAMMKQGNVIDAKGR